MDPLITDYTVVIPTCGDRAELLAGTLRDLLAQRHRPARILVVDASPTQAARAVCASARDSRVQHLVAEHAGAAFQRNQGAALTDTPAIVFCDDDLAIPPGTVGELVSALSHFAGVAARIEGLQHPPPGRLLRAYYRHQAGYAHPHYGARLFGPAINCWPCYALETGPLIPAQWLNSALVAYRAGAFLAERFPDFEGYSYMEDVHLSARIAKSHPIAFHAQAACRHLGVQSTSAKTSRPKLVAAQWANRARVAREVMGTPEDLLQRQLRAHRRFVLLYLLRMRPPGWREEWAALRSLEFNTAPASPPPPSSA